MKLLAVKDAIPGQYIVVLRDGTAAASVNSIAAEQVNTASGQLVRTYQHALQGYSLRASEESVRRLLNDPRVKYVQQNGIVRADTTQVNPPWGLDRIDHRFGLYDQLYSYNATGAGVNAYIIDTGIRITHQDFGGRAQYAFESIGDGNGANDCMGHGTHVAGTVGGSTYGVAKDVNLFSVRVLDCTGSGTWEGVIAGVDWVTANRVLPAVANMSLGGGANQAMDDAVAASVASGVVYAVAGGNSADDACAYSPARTPAAITVGAMAADDTRAWFSNYGTCLDLFGPGVNVLSAWNNSDTGTNTISGTSMATPHVAGTVALYLGLHPSATPAEVTASLVEQATPGQVLDPGTGSPNLLLYEKFIGDTGGGDTTPPSVSLTAPTDGANLSGSWVDITAEASDDVGVEQVVFYIDGSWVQGSSATPDGLYAMVWDSTTVASGQHTITVRAFDAAGNIGSSSTITVNVSNPGSAVWDPTLRVPMCSQQDPFCDSVNLVNGRGIVGPELHAPNNWYDQCQDGNEGAYHADESLDRIRISTFDGSPLAPGKTVQVDVTVWAYGDGSGDALDIFYATDANSPNWQYLTTLVPSAGGLQTLSAWYTLPESATGVEMIRAAFRYGGVPTTCDDGAWSDRDDLAFKVGPGLAPPVASFNVSCHGLRCDFTDTSTDEDGTITNWYWFFSDNSDYTTEQNPTHLFPVSGTYYVALYVVDSHGLYNYTTQMVTVVGVPPVASFSASCSERSCSFTDASTDQDGTIVSRSWSFGDGYSATVQNPVHTYAAAGSYTVSLTVTDDNGLSSTTMRTVVATNPPVIVLTAAGSKVKGEMTVDLAWNGATSATLDVYRNGVLLTNTPNDGAERTTVSKKGTYNYRLCQPGTSYCSNNATVVF
ncbi:MAG TPA: S8 family serine peptidase [Myxococcaceae bacterium]